MRVAIVTINRDGRRLAERFINGFCGEARVYSLKPGNSLKDVVGRIFTKQRFDGIIFIMAAGIVVRVIMPHIKNKYSDPGIVVIDEGGRFSISLLSGHEGRANELAVEAGNILDIEPVITTGSESRKDIIIGIGCRKGIKKEEIIREVKNALRKGKYPLSRVRYIATIDLKRQERGLTEACRKLNVPLRIIPVSAIKEFNGAYQKSSLVMKKIGIGGVSEPCALLAGRKTKLVLPKTKSGRVTVAIAREG